MKILRHAFVLGGFIIPLLLLSLDTTYSQSLPPRAYLFVEVNDTEGKLVNDATVTVSGANGKEVINGKTNKDGVVQDSFWKWSDPHHYNLQISKSGYLPYEQVFFLYPSGNSDRPLHGVEEFINSAEDLKKLQPLPIKIALLKTPVTTAERRAAEVQEQKHQLLLAAKRGDAASLRKLLQAGVKANTADAKGVPAIAWAALAGDAEIIKALLAAGADVRNKNKLGHQALLIYLSEGIFRESKTLKPGYDSSPELEKMLLERREEIVRRLIEAGAGVNLQNSYRGTVLNRAIAQTPYDAQPPKSLSIETIKALIAAKANVNAGDESGQTPLITAARMGSLDIVQLLIEAGASASVNAKDNRGQTALMLASSRNHIGIGVIKTLLEAGASINAKNNRGETALMYAPTSRYHSGSLEAFKFLMAAGANINDVNENGQTLLMLAAERHYGAVIKILLKAGAGASINAKDKRGKTALLYVKSELYDDLSSEIVKDLIAAGADVNVVDENGQQTPLMIAADGFHGRAIKVLLEGGARASIDAKDKQGRTALMIAAENGYADRIKTLLEAGASINARDNRGQTALLYAPSYRYTAPDAIKVLIAAGANINDVNEDGQTALMLAAEKGSIELIKALLESGAGASINAKDKQGRTALMYVKPRYPGNSVSEIVEALRAAGADVNGADKVDRPN